MKTKPIFEKYAINLTATDPLKEFIVGPPKFNMSTTAFKSALEAIAEINHDLPRRPLIRAVELLNVGR